MYYAWFPLPLEKGNPCVKMDKNLNFLVHTLCSIIAHQSYIIIVRVVEQLHLSTPVQMYDFDTQCHFVCTAMSVHMSQVSSKLLSGREPQVS